MTISQQSSELVDLELSKFEQVSSPIIVSKKKPNNQKNYRHDSEDNNNEDVSRPKRKFKLNVVYSDDEEEITPLTKKKTKVDEVYSDVEEDIRQPTKKKSKTIDKENRLDKIDKSNLGLFYFTYVNILKFYLIINII